MNASQRFARLTTTAVVRSPALWRLFRGPLRRHFDRLAPGWEERVGPHHLDALRLGLDAVAPPRRVLDLGTGTGAAARLAAERFPTAEVVGVDVSPGMIEVADARTPAPLAGRVTFLVADAAALPLPSGSCELALLANMIPFFDELDRVLAPAGDVLVSFSFGPRTPIYVPPDRLRHELAARGFTHFADFSAGPAVCLHARRGDARL